MTQQAAHGGEGPSVGTEAEGRSEPKTRPEGAMVMVPREPEVVWVVTASQGEYSDRSEWAVEVHDTEEAGKAAVERLDGEDRIKKAAEKREWYHDDTTHYLSGVPMIRAATQQSPISGEGAWGHAYRRIKFEDGLEIPDAPWTLTREDGLFLILLKDDPEHWEVQPLYAPPVPSVSDQGSSLRDTQPGSADGSSSNEGAA